MAPLNLLKDCKRLVIKIGSALLVDREKHALRLDWLASLGEDIAMLRERGSDVVIVSSGSIALGREILNLPKGALQLAQSQAAAAVGQIALAQAYQEVLVPHKINTAQLLLTSEDSEDRRRYLNTQATLTTLLGMGVVPIVNENDTVATDEIRFGDNDRLAAQVAVMAGADVLVLLSDVDGIYTGNPKTDVTATHIPLIHDVTPELEAMASGVGSEGAKGGMITKLLAAKTAMRGGIKMSIGVGEVSRPILNLLNGAQTSWFIPQNDPAHARKNWITAMKPRGEVIIDDGAVAALGRGSSLLAAGCIGVEGDFSRGDAVDIKNERGHVIARGLIAYDAHEIGKILGVKINDFNIHLGYPGRGSVVHRDNLVTL